MSGFGKRTNIPQNMAAIALPLLIYFYLLYLFVVLLSFRFRRLNVCCDIVLLGDREGTTETGRIRLTPPSKRRVIQDYHSTSAGLFPMGAARDMEHSLSGFYGGRHDIFRCVGEYSRWQICTVVYLEQYLKLRTPIDCAPCGKYVELHGWHWT